MSDLPTGGKDEWLAGVLRDRLFQSPHQRLTFADYMNLVLYHPQSGYYSTGIPTIGRQGDFFTSSHLGADFGELLAQQILQIWDILGHPHPFQLLEMGAGTGQCAGDILRFISTNSPDLLQSLQYLIIETSAKLIRQQKEQLSGYLAQGIRVEWHSWESLPDHSLRGCCFSNEFIDAFPVHQVTVQGGELQEIYVTLEEGKLTEVIGELSTPMIQEYFELLDINLLASTYPENYRTEVNLAALDWLKTLSRKLKQGYVITIDYGYSASQYYHPQRNNGTLQCYYQHHRHSNPYVNLGHQDITAHVNFTALEKWGELLGLKTLGFTKQALFLMALGLGERLAALSGGDWGIMEVLQRRDALHQLMNPDGLGGFGVLVQGKGLTAEQEGIILKALDVPCDPFNEKTVR
ncbi:class I SAM-dependent methyltransferase [Spirulina subsalsa FACHB-351]|uniref:Class I SAM-dependent methyltransferase n=1 Tax=Spirulina subsalsa FACHB-351 TaxID=234711 RepID=A0ABT3L8N3_9CYAN|nr:class I SAM-dependent methyltransferase [Spirulina subsalsa]MCW6037817.1 class I SAM-dependent methyltransferase [Spirulina subsalsa FACHB-351]